MNTMNVSVWNYDSNLTEDPIKKVPIIDEEEDNETYGQLIGYKYVPNEHPEHKVNTYLYGVIFRYHQLSHGYQNFANELVSNKYPISRSVGNKTFKIVLYDEFGRRFPNEDTSQGFKNNLYIELMLE